jgi:hypothetical protein
VKIGKRRLIPSKKGHVSLSSPAGQTWRMRLCNPATRILVGRGHGGTADAGDQTQNEKKWKCRKCKWATRVALRTALEHEQGK